MTSKPTNLTRRNFLRYSATAASGVMIVPRYVVAASGQTPPSERINIAGIGVGGQGAGDINAVAGGNNIVALADADWRRSDETFKKFPNAKKYKDFRKMFDEMEKEIDAVVVGTPDHTHAVTAMAAIKRRKHVYCEKPLAHSVWEVRELMKAAKQYGVVTQLGNQGHSFDTIRTFCEWVWDGAIGKVHTIYAGCSAVNSGRLESLTEEQPVPPELDWDLWLGPAAMRPYNRAYVPGRWRGWVPFGNGTIGDWICHVVDPVFWALDLGAPKTVQADVQDWDPKTQGDVYPKGDIVTFEFPAKGERGPVTLKWHSGNRAIPRPPEFEADEKAVGTGAIVVGDKGTIVYGSHGAGGVHLVPQKRMDDYTRPEKKLPRGLEHHRDWVNAIREGKKAGSDFSYGGPLTELAMLGIIAMKLNGTKLEWDGANMRFNNSAAANGLIKPVYRQGWSL